MSPFTGKLAEVFEALSEENQTLFLEHLSQGTSANVLSRMFESIDVKLSPTTIKEQRTRLLDSLEREVS